MACRGQATANEKSTQIAINDVARSLTGNKRTDHVQINDLLSKAALPSYNELVVKATAMETWGAFSSTDGPGGSRNPLGLIMFGAREDPNIRQRSSRSRSANIVPRPLPFAADTLAANGVKMWNTHSELRSATTKRASKRVATILGKAAPI